MVVSFAEVVCDRVATALPSRRSGAGIVSATGPQSAFPEWAAQRFPKMAGGTPPAAGVAPILPAGRRARWCRVNQNPAGSPDAIGEVARSKAARGWCEWNAGAGGGGWGAVQRSEVPDLGGVIAASGDQPSTVRAEGEAADEAGVTAPRSQ